jgi:tagatose 6-phosphate kinase
VAAVVKAFGRAVRRAGLLALSGSVPAGCGDGFYGRLVREAVRRGVPVMVDAQRAQLIHAAAQRPLVVKVNREELAAATGVDDVRRGMQALQRRGAQWVVITHGADSVMVGSPGGAVTVLRPPRVKAVNPIGSGDAMLAGIAVGVMQGWPMLDAVRFGIACGAANALTAEPGFVDPSEVRRLWRTME